MKISSPDVIRSGERQLIRFIAKHLDREALKKTINESYDIELNDSLIHRSGSIALHRGEIVYRLDFEFKANLSILMSRDGDPVAIASPELKPRKASGKRTLSPETEAAGAGAGDNAKDAEKAKKASEIARMISEINR